MFVAHRYSIKLVIMGSWVPISLGNRSFSNWLFAFIRILIQVLQGGASLHKTDTTLAFYSLRKGPDSRLNTRHKATAISKPMTAAPRVPKQSPGQCGDQMFF